MEVYKHGLFPNGHPFSRPGLEVDARTDGLETDARGMQTTAITFLNASNHFISLTRPLLLRILSVTQDLCETESYRREESGTNFGACARLRYG